MSKRTIHAALGGVTVATVMGSIALANNVTLPNVFQPNTPAKAAEVNANFSAVKASVDDNYSLIGGLQTAQTSTASSVSVLQTAVATLNASQSTYWRRGGNAATTAGTDYLGTSDAQALELKANAARVARFEPATGTSGAPNVILGSAANSASAGVIGAFIAGGGASTTANTVTAAYGVVTGGIGNKAADYAFVGAGSQNVASSLYGFIGSGYGNTNSNTASVVGGGFGNVASGQMSTVPGGWFNTAAGQTSFAAGFRANAALDGCFVWGDATTRSTPVTCSAVNQRVAVASGGVVFQSSGTGTSGVSLAAGGGSWSSLSDRAAKDAVAPVSPAEVLEKVVAMPVSTWSYRTEKGVTHIGPMAQDFYQAFKVGEDDRHIGTVDADGVALAAIQGLNAKTVALEKENAALRAELEGLKARLDALARRAQ